MKVTVAQLNPTVGDIRGNLEKVVNALQCTKDSDLLVFPELFLVGYPPRDLLEKVWFMEKVLRAVSELLEISKSYETGIIIGTPLPTGKHIGRGLYNSALLIHRGQILLSQHKSLLPSYDVFDETRYFEEAPEIKTVSFKGERLGVTICEDAWQEWSERRIYNFNPIEALAKDGTTLFLNISASPFHTGKEEIRFKLIQNHAKNFGPFVYVNEVGGNDELIFDGRSMCFGRDVEPIAILPSFKEHIQTVDMNLSGKETYVHKTK